MRRNELILEERRKEVGKEEYREEEREGRRENWEGCWKAEERVGGRKQRQGERRGYAVVVDYGTLGMTDGHVGTTRQA